MGIFKRVLEYSLVYWLIRKLFGFMVLLVLAIVAFGYLASMHIGPSPTSKASSLTSIGNAFKSIESAGMAVGHTLARKQNVLHGMIAEHKDAEAFPESDSGMTAVGHVEKAGTVWIYFGNGQHQASLQTFAVHASRLASVVCFTSVRGRPGCGSTRAPPADTGVALFPVAITSSDWILTPTGHGFVAFHDTSRAKAILDVLNKQKPKEAE